MAKFKRLSRFLERIGIKKQQAKESVELASSSRSWRRFWKRRTEPRTAQPGPRYTGQSKTNDLWRMGRLFRIRKMKSSASKCRGQSDAEDVVGAPKRDAVRVGSVQYSGVGDSDNLLSSADTVVLVIVAGSSDEGDLAIAATPICTEPSYGYDTIEAAISEAAASEAAISKEVATTEMTDLPIVWEDSSSDLTSINDMTLERDSSLTLVTNLTTEDDVISTASKSMKVKFDLMKIQDGKDGFEGTQLDDNYQYAVSIYQLQCGGIKELVDGEDEGEQSCIIDDYIIIFLPVIVVMLFMLLLPLTGCS